MNDEKIEKSYRLTLDRTPDEIKFLAEIGLKLIAKDETALVEYAVIKIIEDQIKELEGMDRDGIMKKIKATKGKK